MNFSKNIKLGKTVTFLLALSLVATMFTGCFGGNEETEPSTPDINLNLSESTGPSETQPLPTETEATEPNENMATVLNQLPIRVAPMNDSNIVGTLQAGDRVEVTRREGVHGVNWGYILSSDGSYESGWICLDFVEFDIEPEDPVGSDTSTPAGTNPTEPDNQNGTTTNIKGVVTANGLYIREEPSTTGKILGSYDKGDVITILETKNGWGRTSKGWVKMDYVNTSGTNNTTTPDNNTDNENVTGNGNTTVQFKGVVTAQELNIRASASTAAEKVGMYTYGERVEFLEKDGTWGRTNKGWISLSYVYQDGSTGTKTAKGTVTAEGGLNIRSGPGTGYGSVGSYANGETITILEQFTINGTTWGCTNKGWVSMAYVDADETASVEVTGTIIADGLRIRNGAGTDYDVVGSLKFGDKVTILSQKTVGDVTWGQIDKGWISMAYVELD